jgi:hypothetical protein
MLIPEIISGGGGEHRQAVVCATDGFPSLDLAVSDLSRLLANFI